MIELDELDRKLISLLRADGRAPVTTLARQLGVTRATVNSRFERLRENGVVLGFTVRVREDYGDDSVRAISMIDVEARATQDVVRALRGIAQIQTLHSTNGTWDLVAEVRAESLLELDDVLNAIRSVDGVMRSETSLLLTSVLRD